MGVVNTTPDSFSDGGLFAARDAAVAHARRLVAEGADLIDIGGESGVTDRAPVDPVEECARVVPVIERLAAAGVATSVDTWKAPVARAAVAAGAAMVNDVSGLADPALADVCAESRAALVVTHTRVAPKVKRFPGYEDVVADVLAFLDERIALARERGVEEEQIVVDPGLDLAKTPAETVAVLRGLRELHALGRPVLLAASRKDCVGAVAGRPPAARTAGTLAAVAEGVDAGAAIVRVHDVEAVSDFLAVRAALRGERDVAADARLEPSLRREAVRGRVR